MTLVKTLIVAVIVYACNQRVDTGSAVATDSLTARDSSLAKGDSLIIDSLTTDTLKVDNTQNNDTVSLLPSKDITTNNVRPDELVTFAETLMGTPYVYASTDPKVGFDCSGFITYVFNHFGISVPRSSIDFTDVGKEVLVANARRGDLILFTGTDPAERFVGHMGIVVSNADTLKFIHSTSGKAMSVTITPLNKYYLNRFVKVIRVFAQNEYGQS